MSAPPPISDDDRAAVSAVLEAASSTWDDVRWPLHSGAPFGLSIPPGSAPAVLAALAAAGVSVQPEREAPRHEALVVLPSMTLRLHAGLYGRDLSTAVAATALAWDAHLTAHGTAPGRDTSVTAASFADLEPRRLRDQFHLAVDEHLAAGRFGEHASAEGAALVLAVLLESAAGLDAGAVVGSRTRLGPLLALVEAVQDNRGLLAAAGVLARPENLPGAGTTASALLEDRARASASTAASTAVRPAVQDRGPVRLSSPRTAPGAPTPHLG